MPYTTCSKTLKANSVALFFLLVISGLIFVSFVVAKGGDGSGGESFTPAPIVFVTAETQKPLASNSPEIPEVPIEVLTIPAVQVATAEKDAKQKTAVIVPRAVQGLSAARLIIPRINVDAVIRETGITLEGAMAVPSNRVDVGWYSFGTYPGETGSAVIGGHNRWDGGIAVFDRLDQLEKGDVLSVVNEKGDATTFVVRDMRTYDATDVNSGIFESDSGAHLNLITCSGVWNPLTNSYTTRYVIFTDVVQAAHHNVAVPI